MQEVVKRMQERQAPKKKGFEPGEYVRLVLAKISEDTTVPVVLPSGTWTSAGDYVFFMVDKTMYRGEVLFSDMCDVDGTLWTAVIVMSGITQPYKAVKWAKVHEIEWEEETT